MRAAARGRVPPGVRKRRQSCVPRGSQPQHVLGADDRLTKLAAVRLSVERTTSPPGRVTAARPPGTPPRPATCSMTSSDDEVEAAPRPRAPRPVASVVDLEADLLGVPRARSRCCSRAGRSPVTRAPRRASGSASNPPPQPTSSTRRPRQRRGRADRGRNGGRLDRGCRLRRTGLSLCRGAIGPVASHQARPSSANFSSSAGSAVVSGCGGRTRHG